jgi:resuscitation-promoting factor RpfA
MGVLAEAPRTAAGRVLALGGAAVGCGALAIGLAVRVGYLATRVGVTRPDELVELVVLGAGVLVLAWLAGSSGLAAACLVTRRMGHAWRRGEGCVQRFAPALVRRALVVVVAAGLGAASVGAASAADLPPTSPSATAVADGGPIDLGWVVSTPVGAVPTPAVTSSPAADTPISPSPTGPAPLQSPTATPAGSSPAAPARVQASAPVTAPADAPSGAHGAAPRPATTVGTADALPMPYAAAPAAHRPARDEVATVVVLRGDTLWGIAARHLPPGASAAEVADAWPAWYAANAATIGPDPGLILPGQVLVAPAEVAR